MSETRDPILENMEAFYKECHAQVREMREKLKIATVANEQFKADLHHRDAENAQLREKLAAAEEKRDMWLRIAQRLFKERQTMLHGHVYNLPTDDVILEATILEAIIDGKEANETT